MYDDTLEGVSLAFPFLLPSRGRIPVPFFFRVFELSLAANGSGLRRET